MQVFVVVPFEFDQIFDRHGQPLTIWHAASNDGQCQQHHPGSAKPEALGLNQQHRDDDHAGEKRGADIHKRPGVGLIFDKIQMTLRAMVVDGVPVDKYQPDSALWASFTQASK